MRLSTIASVHYYCLYNLIIIHINNICRIGALKYNILSVSALKSISKVCDVILVTSNPSSCIFHVILEVGGV